MSIPANLAGMGNHIFCIPLPNLIFGLRITFISEILVFVSIFFVKLSITLFLLKIGGLRKPLKIALIVNVIFLGLANLAFIIELLAQCRPIEANWDVTLKPTAQCISVAGTVDISYLAAAISAFTDFCLVVIPLPIIWDLKMSRRTKWSIIALMLMGLLAMICGIVRATQVSNLNDTEDITWAIIPIGLWTEAEFYIGIITGSLPACRGLFLRLVAKARSQPPPATEDTFGRRFGSGRSYMLQSLSRVGRLLTGSRRSPTDSIRLPESSNDASVRWRDARKMESQSSDVESARQDGGITKTVTMQLQHEERRKSGW